MCWCKMRNSRVTGDPADIGHTSKPVLGVDIENVLEGQGSAEKVTPGGVDDTLWLASGPRGLKESRSVVRNSC